MKKNQAKEIVDKVIADLRRMDATLSGDDTPLISVWDEIKEQVQNEESYYWDTYVETMRSLLSYFINEAREAGTFVYPPFCDEEDDEEEIEDAYLEMLLARAEHEPIECRPFDFTYFCYPLVDFTVYGKVLKRTGIDTCHAKVFSKAAPHGETGTVQVSRIECLLTEAEFDMAMQLDWPETWNGD